MAGVSTVRASWRTGADRLHEPSLCGMCAEGQAHGHSTVGFTQPRIKLADKARCHASSVPRPGWSSGIAVGGSAAPCTAIQSGRHYPSCRIGRGQAFLQGILRMPQRRRRWFRLFSGLAPVGADICKAIFGAQGAAEKISLKGRKTHRSE